MEWSTDKPDDVPPFLQVPQGSNYLTLVDVTGIHFVGPLLCLPHLPAISVLNDFIRNNLECRTSASNYYNKLQRITSNVFPHLMSVISHQWQLLKLLKLASFGHQQDSPKPGSLVLFCPTCPQPGINDTDPCSWKYNQMLIMDGNFKAEHLYDRRTDGQVWLMDGLGFMVSQLPYHEYLSSCNNHKAVNQVNSSHAQLEATGIGGMACAHHGCFVPHSVVDFQKGERCTVA
ncbi:hypothetical protein BS17DRAFT_796321 [Gyrodon lividus]|nr:hypothetical protein BS17DRAFT_796321 [Gyrodon lividus]